MHMTQKINTIVTIVNVSGKITERELLCFYIKV